MLPCKGSSSSSMVFLAWTSWPLDSGGRACCCPDGTVAASTSMTPLWEDVWDRASGVVSDASLESDSRCASCVWSPVARDCAASTVSAVVCGCCRGVAAVLMWCCAGCCGKAL